MPLPYERPDKAKELYEDLLAILAVQDGILEPHLQRLVIAAERRDPALQVAIRRWLATTSRA